MRDLVKHDSQSLTLHALGQLSETDAVALEAHLATCAECTREWKEVRDTTALLDEHVPDEAFLEALTDTARADPNDLVFKVAFCPPYAGRSGRRPGTAYCGPSPRPPRWSWSRWPGRSRSAAPAHRSHRPRSCRSPARGQFRAPA